MFSCQVKMIGIGIMDLLALICPRSALPPVLGRKSKANRSEQSVSQSVKSVFSINDTFNNPSVGGSRIGETCPDPPRWPAVSLSLSLVPNVMRLRETCEWKCRETRVAEYMRSYGGTVEGRENDPTHAMQHGRRI